jgi:DNA helicase-2/ATP-dependent DNA helicase PcrA
MPNPEITNVRLMAHACIEAISKTLITEQRNFQPAEFSLDQFQRRLIETDHKFVRVVAPAGSGKTRSLTAKAFTELQKLTNARILCLTFTNAAASEFKERARMSGATATGDIHISTVNSFGYEIVKNFTPDHRLIGSTADRLIGVIFGIIKQLLSEKPLGAPDQHKFLYRQILELCDLTKSLGFSHDDTAQQASAHYSLLSQLRIAPILHAKMQEIEILPSMPTLLPESKPDVVFSRLWFPFWKELVRRLWEARLLTLDDQKYWGQHLLAGEPKARGWLERMGLTHVMVDEFQDINFLDLYLVAQVVNLTDSSLFIVGDDDQCIYEWRGCTSHFIRDPDTFLQFIHGGRKFETILLEQNYRCPRNVVQHASKLIAHNQQRLSKSIKAIRTDDANIRVVPLPAAYLTMHVVDELVAALANRHPSHSIAVLARKKCQLLPIHILFNKRGTRFYVDEDLNVFLGRAFASFREIIALPPKHKALVGSARSVEQVLLLLNRLKKKPVSQQETDAIKKYLHQHKPQTLEEGLRLFGAYPGEFKRGYVEPSEAAIDLTRFLEANSVVDALMAASEVLKGFEKDFVKSKEDIFYSDPPFGHLADLAVDYGSDFAGFIADIDKTIQGAEAHSARGPKVELMTALRVKGREFDTVIVLDANDGIWPSEPAVKAGHIEAERRLFYVAVTRTKCNLLIFESGRVQGKQLNPSPFIGELELPASAWIKNPDINRVSADLMSTLRL